MWISSTGFSHQEQGSFASSLIEKRSTALAATAAITKPVDSNSNNGNNESRKVDDNTRRNLVTMQIVI
jgi:hypothetical protein